MKLHKIITIILTAVMLTAAVPAYAEDEHSFTIENGTLKDYSGPGGDVVIPDGVTVIGENAFKYSSITSVVIPDSVTIIDENAFYYCKKLTDVTIPDSVIAIGERAFCYCISLESITIPGSVSNISRSMFDGCSALQDVTLSEGIKTIEKYAFSCRTGEFIGAKKEHYSSLTEISIPASVTFIDSDAFNELFNYGALNLARINVDPENRVYSSRDGVLYNKAVTEIVIIPRGYIGKYTIPSTVSVISGDTFAQCNSLTEVEFPDSTAIDGELDMHECTSLESVDIPYGTVLAEMAFKDCSNLKSVRIPNTVTEIPDRAFYYCINLTDIELPDSITAIGEAAFLRCEKLPEINIPEKVTVIQGYTFCSCYSLVRVDIHENITSVAPSAFGSCTNLLYIEADPKNEAYTTQNGVLFTKDMSTLVRCPIGISGKYTVPDGVTVIGYDAFSGCSQLSEIILPDTLETISRWAFRSCNKIEEITIPASVTELNEGIAYIFYDCMSLTCINVDSDHPYYSSVDGFLCSKDGTTLILCPPGKTGKVTVPVGITVIGEESFVDNIRITSVSLPDGLKKVEPAAFWGCSELTSLLIPEGTEYFGGAAVDCCDALERLILPQSLTYFGGMSWPADCPPDFKVFYIAGTNKHVEKFAEMLHTGREMPPSDIPGDANGDGKADLSDVSLILQYIAYWDVIPNPYTADVTGDNIVNLADVSLMLKFIAGWDVKLT